jgi:hypothetical protein
MIQRRHLGERCARHLGADAARITERDADPDPRR